MIYAVGYLMGLVMLVIGLKVHRQYRLMADTPELPVRGLPAGLVRVRGKATGADRATSPLTKVPCFYYEVLVEKQVKKMDNEGDQRTSWQQDSRTMDQRPFHLADATGKVLVNPENAQFDVLRTFYGEVQTGLVSQIGHLMRSVAPSLGVPGPSEDDLRAFLVAGTASAASTLASSGIPGAAIVGKAMSAGQKLENIGVSVGSVGGGHHYRFTEYCLLADQEVTILGTCAPNPGSKGADDLNVLMRGTTEKTFLISTSTGSKVGSSLRTKAFVLVAAGVAILAGITALALHNASLR